MDCETLVKYLSDYIDRDLSAELEAAAREHLGSCQNCQVMLDSTQRLIRLSRSARNELTIPAWRKQRLYDQLEAILSVRREEDAGGA